MTTLDQLTQASLVHHHLLTCLSFLNAQWTNHPMDHHMFVDLDTKIKQQLERIEALERYQLGLEKL